MTNALILYDDKVRLAVVSASGSQGGLVAANVADDQPKKVWRADAATASLTFSWAERYGLSMVMIVNHNLGYEGTIRIEVSNNADLSAASFDATIDAWDPFYGADDIGIDECTVGGLPLPDEFKDYRPIVVAHNPGVAGQYMRLTFSDPTNPAGYVEAGKVLAGVGRSAALNFSRDWSHEWVDSSDEVEMEDGSVWVEQGVKYRELNLAFNDLSEAEAMGWVDDFMRIAGASRPFGLVPFPDDVKLRYRTSLYGKVPARTRQSMFHPYQNARRLALRVRELV